MEGQWILSPSRQLTEEERFLVWRKPATHIESDAERRICLEVKRNWQRGEMKITNILLEGDAGSGKTQLAKALSANFGLPYTKITCFADMDKSDVIGAILPVLSPSQQAESDIADTEALSALCQSDSFHKASQLLDGPEEQAVGRIHSVASCLLATPRQEAIEYRFYPSEIVRAFRSGYLLEIQEPTVIRDAAVLMMLNSALEPDGSINLPTEVIHRHPDFITVITTNRGYNGCRPLNESLRDRVQHTEKMDLPDCSVMAERAMAKTGCTDEKLLLTFARVIVLLDQAAKANAIKGVAGMRSYFFWLDAVMQGAETMDALYHKVIYKITTDPDEIAILEQELLAQDMLPQLEEISERRGRTNGEVMEIRAEGNSEDVFPSSMTEDDAAVALRRSADSEGYSARRAENSTDTQSADAGEDGEPIYHELQSPSKDELQGIKREFRKQLNQEAREMVKGSIHERIKMIVHRPEATLAHHREYHQIASSILPTIRELVRKTAPLLEHEVSVDFSKARAYGTKFNAERLASQDFRYFSQKRPPDEEPSLAVAFRIDESASMKAFGRLDAAKQAVVAVYEFCEQCGIPMLIYGDTADRSPLEQMSLYSYIDFEKPELNDKYCLMAIQGHSNNRDGMALRILAEKLARAPQVTKLLISISDGQPKATPDYTGALAVSDMKDVIQEYSRKGIIFLTAAIGQDKDVIGDIYGKERYIDITDLKKLPARLVQIIARYV